MTDPVGSPDLPPPVPISVIVLTFNEAANIATCLDSVAGWADEIFVVDSGSTDNTVEIAGRYTSEIVTHPFVNQSQQFNWAIDHLPIRTAWVMRLDADEYLLPELRQEIGRVLPTLSDDVTGIMMKRRVYFQGRWIRHGGYYPTWLLRLFRRGWARSEELSMDEHIVVLTGRTIRLQHDFVDFNRMSLAQWLAKHARYAAREAEAVEAAEGGVRPALLSSQPARKRWLKKNVYRRFPPFVRALAFFLYRYIMRAGFLDGPQGLIFHVLQGFWYRFYIDALVWEAGRDATVESVPVPGHGGQGQGDKEA